MNRRQQQAQGPAAAAPGPAETLLVFRLGSQTYGIAIEAVDGLNECGPVRAVAGAPASVLGLAEWRGSLVTVLDLARLLGQCPVRQGACWLRLAPPMDRTALVLPVGVRLAHGQLADPAGGGGSKTITPGRLTDGEAVHVVQPEPLVRRLRHQLWGLT